MANNTFIKVPYNVDDPTTLRRFLELLIEKLDEAFGNRGGDGFTPQDEFKSSNATIADTLNDLVEESEEYLKLDGSRKANKALQYEEGVEIELYEDIANIGYIKKQGFTSNPEQPNVADTSTVVVTASDTYEKTELQQVSDNVESLRVTIDSILKALRNSHILSDI